jgi:pilus assembly protein CpaB
MIGISIFAALAAVLLASRWITQQARLQTNKVAVAAVDINLGTRLTPEMIRITDWPAGSVPEGGFTDVRAVETRVARVSLLRGEPVTESKLALHGATGGLSAVVAEGKRAMTVRVNDVIGVAGFALPGNFVDILVSTQEETSKAGNRDPSISKLVLERILVLAVAQEASQSDTRPKVVSAVTLEVTPRQAEKLDLARSVGQLSLVLRNQVDLKPALTEGATKQSLLYLPTAAARIAEPAPEPAPVVRKKIAVRQPVRPPATECQHVITGSGRITQCD